MKPLSEACLRNQGPIADILATLLVGDERVLELGSGTGQHAVYMASRFPGLRWQPTDLASALPGINAWRHESQLENVAPPQVLDVREALWSVQQEGLPPYDAVFTANTVHFVDANTVTALLAGVARTLRSGGFLLVYGPFNQDQQYTSDGNRRLDQWLRQRDPASGIKDLERFSAEAARFGLRLQQVQHLPANNLLLVLVRSGPETDDEDANQQ